MLSAMGEETLILIFAVGMPGTPLAAIQRKDATAGTLGFKHAADR
jgi:hypothetical protein